MSITSHRKSTKLNPQELAQLVQHSAQKPIATNDKKEADLKHIRESKFIKKNPNNTKILNSFNIGDFKVDRNIPEKTVYLINSLFYSKKVDDEAVKILQLILSHTRFAKVLNKNILETILKFIKLEQIAENEVLSAKDFNEGYSFIILDGEIAFAQLDNHNHYMIHELDKRFLEKGFKEKEKIIATKVGYDITHDLNKNHEFITMSDNISHIYSTTCSLVISMNMSYVQDVINKYFINAKAKKKMEFIKYSLPGYDTLSFNTIEKYTQYFNEKLFEPKEKFIEEGENHPYIYVLLEGRVKLKALKSVVLNSELDSEKQKNLKYEVDIAIYDAEKWINEDCLSSHSKSLFTYIPLTHIRTYQIKREDFLRKIYKFSPATLMFFKASSGYKKILYNYRLNQTENNSNVEYLDHKKNTLFFNMGELAVHYPKAVRRIYDKSDMELFYQFIVRKQYLDGIKSEAYHFFMNKDFEDAIRQGITERYDEIGKMNNKTNLSVFQNFSDNEKLRKSNKHESSNPVSTLMETIVLNNSTNLNMSMNMTRAKSATNMSNRVKSAVCLVREKSAKSNLNRIKSSTSRLKSTTASTATMTTSSSMKNLHKRITSANRDTNKDLDNSLTKREDFYDIENKLSLKKRMIIEDILKPSENLKNFNMEKRELEVEYENFVKKPPSIRSASVSAKNKGLLFNNFRRKNSQCFSTNVKLMVAAHYRSPGTYVIANLNR